MKTPEEYLLENEIDPDILADQMPYTDIGVRNAIKQAQKDAYSQAIEDAVENASCEYERDYLTGNVDKKSILKLKK